MNSIKWGIVSTGRICDQFTQDLAYVDHAQVLGVAARHLNDAQAFAKKHNIDRAYQGYQALFDDPDIDVVYIGTPHTFHFQHAVDAIKAGKHVLCEKPITINSSQMLELKSLAKSQGVFLMEAMWTFFLPALKQAKSWVDQGRIGKVLHVKADFGYPMPYVENSREYSKSLAGGCLLDMGIYPIAIAGLILDEQSPEVWQVNSHLAPNGVEDDVIMLANIGNAIVSLATSFRCKLHNYAYLIGDKGYIEIPDFWRASRCDLYQLEKKVDSFDEQRKSLGFNYEAQAVTNAILNGELESDVMPHRSSLWLQAQMEAIKLQITG